MRRFVLMMMLVMLPLAAGAQVDRREVRAGNRDFRKGSFSEAEIDYRRAVVKDSTSFAGQYNLANSLYRKQDWEGASKALDAIRDASPLATSRPVTKGDNMVADRYYNAGDVALQKKDYAAAVEAFRNALLLTPGDLDAKENYIYAKKMLENQQGGGGGNDNNQDQNSQDDQNNDQDQQDQNRDQQNGDDNRQDPQQGQQPQEQKISPQQAQQMLKAIQAKEKDTQDKVNKEKAALLQSRQKEKNW